MNVIRVQDSDVVFAWKFTVDLETDVFVMEKRGVIVLALFGVCRALKILILVS